MTFKQFAKLKPSALIQLALADLREVEKDKRYAVDMGQWHTPPSCIHQQCLVCFAGSVMAKSLNTPIDESLVPVVFTDLRVRERLLALNDFRTGDIECGLANMGIPNKKGLKRRKVSPYRVSPKTFRRQMRAVAAYLERNGL